MKKKSYLDSYLYALKEEKLFCKGLVLEYIKYLSENDLIRRDCSLEDYIDIMIESLSSKASRSYEEEVKLAEYEFEKAKVECKIQ